MSKSQILVIVGPTASGKSAFAIKLAKKFKGEIVSADSRQVYVGLDIGSGKVSKREMAGVPHHMLDVANPRRVYTVSDYKRDAEKAIDEILLRGKLPILVGGTGHYVDAVAKGLVLPEVEPDPKLRARLDKILKSKNGTDKLYKILARLDKDRAKQIDKHNPRRLVRAIEIATALGKVPKLVEKPRYSTVILGIRIMNDELRIKIRERLNARMRVGLVQEVRNLHEKHKLSWKRLEQLGLEYKYVALYLQNKLTKVEMLSQLETAIVQYSKRQMTWFKANNNTAWCNADEKAILPFLASLPGLRGKVKSPPRLS